MGNFLDAQGYTLVNNIVLQDNESSIKIETNGRLSCTGNSRHVNIRLFFMKDKVDQKEITIEHCPTGEMLADFYTKPQQGGLFHRMRAVLMGWKPLSSLNIKEDNNNYTESDVIAIKERVVNNELIERNDSDRMTKTTVNPVGVQTYADIVQKTSRNFIQPNVAAE